MDEEQSIRSVLGKMKYYANSRKIDEIMSLYKTDISSFEFGEVRDYEKIKVNCIKGYSRIKGEFEFGFKIEKIIIRDDIACVYGIQEISGINVNGRFEEKILATYIFEKINEKWLIIHHHLSSNPKM